MEQSVFDHWKKKGYSLDPILLDRPGTIIRYNNAPYYHSDIQEKLFDGREHGLIASRYAVAVKLKRPLFRHEIVRFKTSNKKDFRLENLVLHSRTASAKELHMVGGQIVLGYSHCLCECGEELDIQLQAVRPFAYSPGHSPADKQRMSTLQASVDKPTKRKRVRKKKEQTMPVTPAPKGLPAEPQITEYNEDSLKSFRCLFEKMISELPWNEFKEILDRLLDVKTRKDRSK